MGDYQAKFDKHLSQFEKHLSCRSLSDVLLQAKNNFNLTQLNEIMDLDAEQIKSSSSTGDTDDENTESCASPSSSRSSRCSQSKTTADNSLSLSRPVTQTLQSTVVDAKRPPPIISETYLKHWMQMVQSQRQIIQNQEYWR